MIKLYGSAISNYYAMVMIFMLEKGFDFVESGPLVRSSYHAERHVFPNQHKEVGALEKY